MLYLFVPLPSSKMAWVKSPSIWWEGWSGEIEWGYRGHQEESAVCGQDLTLKTGSIFRFPSVHSRKPQEGMLNPWHSPLKKLPMSVLDTQIGCKVQVWAKLAKSSLSNSDKQRQLLRWTKCDKLRASVDPRAIFEFWTLAKALVN